MMDKDKHGIDLQVSIGLRGWGGWGGAESELLIRNFAAKQW